MLRIDFQIDFVETKENFLKRVMMPSNILKMIKRGIARRILSQNREKWWTVATCFTEIDTLRDKYSDENDHEKLKFLDELNEYVMTIQKKYENI